MHVIPNSRAMPQWRVISCQPPRLVTRVLNRFFDEQETLAIFLVTMARSATAPSSEPMPTTFRMDQLSKCEATLLDHAAILLEIFRREAGHPLPRLDEDALEQRLETLTRALSKALDTGGPFPPSPQPDLLAGVRYAFHTDLTSIGESVSTVFPMLLQVIVDAFDTAAGVQTDLTAPPVENWTPDRIEEALSVAGDPMRAEALAAAGRFRSDMVPRLIAAVERVMSPEPDPDSADDILWIHALFLLAEWREPTAADLAACFFSADTEARQRLPDVFFLDYAPQLMASLLGHEPARLLEIAANPAADSNFRCDAIRALGCLAAWGQLERPVLVEHLRSLARGGIVQEPDDEWTTLAGLVLDAGLRDLVPDLEPACQQGWVSDQFYPWETLQQLADSPHDRWTTFVEHHQFRSDIAELTSWLDQDRGPAGSPQPFDTSLFEEAAATLPTGYLDEPATPFRAPATVGRNDPCPCGSGRKFKKCCGA